MINPLTASADQLMTAYLTVQDPREESRLLERLSLELRAVVMRVLYRQFGGSPGERDRVEDACQECMLAILGKLQRVKRGDEPEAVRSISAYAAAAAQNSFRGEMRQQDPERARLRSRVLRLIETHPDRFTLVTRSGSAFCSLQSANCIPVNGAIARSDGLSPGDASVPATRKRAGALDTADLEELLRTNGGEMELRVLIDHFVSKGALAPEHVGGRIAFRGDAHRKETALAADLPDPLERIPDMSQDVEAQAIDGVYREQLLRHAWDEILALPVRQRHALLLSLPPDVFQAYRLLVGRAGMARCLELAPAELDGIVISLPLSDNQIADRLGVARQQVINLRLAARQRIGRNITN